MAPTIEGPPENNVVTLSESAAASVTAESDTSGTKGRELKQLTVSRVYTKFQQELLRGFLNVPLKRKMRNVMFAVIEMDGDLLFYHYYVSYNDQLHSEFYLKKHVQGIIQQIKEQLIGLNYNITDFIDKVMNMTIFSKNSSCNKCAITHEYVINFRDEFNKESDMQLKEIQFQHIRIYTDPNGKVHNEAIKYYEENDIGCEQLDWVGFLALYIQWCHTHQECVSLNECSNHAHQIEDDKYKQIRQRQFSTQEAKDELQRLTLIDTEEDLKRKQKIAQIVANFLRKTAQNELRDDISNYSAQDESLLQSELNSEVSDTSVRSKINNQKIQADGIPDETRQLQAKIKNQQDTIKRLASQLQEYKNHYLSYRQLLQDFSHLVDHNSMLEAEILRLRENQAHTFDP
ncbi:uncharacterized protein [Amphiura filiformis]|uniref:uncharacterized protein n=1 Tax=Amphiura filiformis TaxID=82378 RepID=UPI003B22543C